MVGQVSEADEPQHLLLTGYEHEWPADFEAFVARELIARDGALVARLEELGDAPAFLSSSDVSALIVNANRLGLKGKVALQECRRISPSTAVVVVATTPAHGLKDALEGGATAFVSWPAPPDVLRRALHGGRETTAPALAGPDREDVRDPDVRPAAPLSAPRETPSRRPAPPAPGLEGAREKMAVEIAALVRLAELDAALLDRDARRSAAVAEDAARERRGLVAKLSAEVLEAYERALRAGRRPAVVRLVGSVCSGCYVRLHSKLDHQIRHRRGAAACPHCLRVVYDPGRLAA